MSRIWEIRVAALDADAEKLDCRSPVLRRLDRIFRGEEWRTIWELRCETLVQRLDKTIRTAGPIVIGVRYHKSFLSQAPHPLEIVTVLHPQRVFHPNVSPAGAVCLGHPLPGLSLETILHQTWAGLTLNMGQINTANGEILNLEAAQFVRANSARFPLTEKGIFEEPDPAGVAAFPGGMFGVG